MGRNEQSKPSLQNFKKEGCILFKLLHFKEESVPSVISELRDKRTGKIMMPELSLSQAQPVQRSGIKHNFPSMLSAINLGRQHKGADEKENYKL